MTQNESMVSKAAYDNWLARALANAERVYDVCAPQMEESQSRKAKEYLEELRNHVSKCRENLAQNPGIVFPSSVASQWRLYVLSVTQIIVTELGGM